MHFPGFAPVRTLPVHCSDKHKRTPCSAGEEQDDLIYEKLPHDIAHRHVLLMDPILGTGNTVARAIQVRCPPRVVPAYIEKFRIFRAIFWVSLREN